MKHTEISTKYRITDEAHAFGRPIITFYDKDGKTLSFRWATVDEIMKWQQLEELRHIRAATDELVELAKRQLEALRDLQPRRL